MTIANIKNKKLPVKKQSLLQQVIRVHDEPYRYFNDWQVHNMLTRQPLHYLDHLLTQLQQLASGESTIELPNKLVFNDADAFSDFRVMPCVIHHPQRIRKIVKLVGTNGPRQQVPDQITVGKAFALDEKENFVSAGFAGCLLSSARTGACVATAARLLSTDSKQVDIIGSGRVGYYAALYIATLGKTEHICFYDNILERAENAATLLSQTFPKIKFTVSTTQESLANIVVLATDSHQPIYGKNNKNANLVISVGADTHWQHELSEQILGKVDIFVDTLDSFNCGDLGQWSAQGKVTENSATDLLTLLRDTQKKDHQQADKPAVFISTGSALFDNLTIDYLLENE